MHSNIKEKLKNGEYRIGIWGLGYIGYSSMAYFAKNGVSCIGTDIKKLRIDNINTE
jgi:UDP-N-acetyl-D-mannosaminuronate dehydrogenase